MTATTTQYDLVAVRCGCGREHAPTQPAGVPRAPVSYGPNLRALVVYLLVFQHLPVERAGQLVEAVTGAAPSPGFVHGMIARGAAAVAGTVEDIKESIKDVNVYPWCRGAQAGRSAGSDQPGDPLRARE
ncbi:transposase [Frankia sp. CiP1_Cm_nod2]|uniref:transposase n=1 Tax=Frankia sp. CiP1_Cm_nod2 TaxID=2897161 RepID=UPI0020252DED